MKFIKNINQYIDPKMLETMLTTTGVVKPALEVHDYQQEIASKWSSAGIDMKKIGWEFFNSDNLTNLTLPFKRYSWWCSKLKPGDMFPMHIDTYPDNESITRYWVALQDHMPGHIFMYDKQVLTDYKAGDMFLFEDNKCWHGAANLGFVPKISLQIVVYEH